MRYKIIPEIDFLGEKVYRLYQKRQWFLPWCYVRSGSKERLSSLVEFLRNGVEEL